MATSFGCARLFPLLLLLAIGLSDSFSVKARRHRPREFAEQSFISPEDSLADVERESRNGGEEQPETLGSKTVIQELPKEEGEIKSPFDGLKNPFDGPKNPFDGSMAPGGDFGSPECLSKRCNPFRSHRPVYYRRYFDKESGPFDPPKGYYHHIKRNHHAHLPVYTEVIIIRKVPIMLSKLLVIAKANADGYKPKPKPDYPIPPPDPVLLKKGGELPVKSGKPEVPPELDELEDQLTLQRDQPTVELEGKTGGEDQQKGKPKYDPKDGAFESLMGVEEMVPVPDGVKNKDKQGPEAKKDLGGKSGEGVKQRQMVTEYLERPAADKSNDVEDGGEGGGEGDDGYRRGGRGEQRPPKEE